MSLHDIILCSFPALFFFLLFFSPVLSSDTFPSLSLTPTRPPPSLFLFFSLFLYPFSLLLSLRYSLPFLANQFFFYSVLFPLHLLSSSCIIHPSLITVFFLTFLFFWNTRFYFLYRLFFKNRSNSVHLSKN